MKICIYLICILFLSYCVLGAQIEETCDVDRTSQAKSCTNLAADPALDPSCQELCDPGIPADGPNGCGKDICQGPPPYNEPGLESGSYYTCADTNGNEPGVASCICKCKRTREVKNVKVANTYPTPVVMIDTATGQQLVPGDNPTTTGPVTVKKADDNKLIARYKIDNSPLEEVDLVWSEIEYIKVYPDVIIIDDSNYEEMDPYDPAYPQEEHGKMVIFEDHMELIYVCNEEGHDPLEYCNSPDNELTFTQEEIDLGTTKTTGNGKRVTVGRVNIEGESKIAVTGEIDCLAVGSVVPTGNGIPESSTFGLVIAFVLIVIGIILIIKKKKH